MHAGCLMNGTVSHQWWNELPVTGGKPEAISWLLLGFMLWMEVARARVMGLEGPQSVPEGRFSFC